MARSIELARLFYTIEANTKGLQGDLDKSERSLGRLSSFIKANPVAAFGALGAAAIAVGVQATKMAAEVDAGIRKIGTNLPEAVERMDSLKQVAKDLSIQFGIAQTDIVAAMQAIAAGGVESTDDLIARTRAVAKVVTATGAEMSTVVGLLDKTLDVFSLSGEESEKVLAKLLATARGKVSLEELAQAMERIGPTAQAAGANFEDVAAALVTMVNQGLTSKQAISELTKVLEVDGKAGLERYAAASRVAGDGLKELNDQANTNLGTLEKQSAILKAQLNAQLIDLGTTILPLVVAGFSKLNDILQLVTGGLAKMQHEIKQNSATATVDSLTGSIGKLQNQVSKTEATDRLLESLRQLTQGARAFTTSFARQVEALPIEQLERLRKGYEAAAASGTLSAQESKEVARALDLVKAALEGKTAAAKTDETQTKSGIATLRTLTEEERKAVEQSKTLLDGQKELILNATNLTGEQLKLVGQAVKEMGKATDASGKAATAAAEKHAAAIARIRETLIASTTTLIDDTELAIERLTGELNEAGVSFVEVAEGVRPFREQLALIKVNELFKLPDILQKSARALTTIDVAALTEARVQLQGLLAETRAGTNEHLAIQQRLDEVSAKLAEHYRKLPPLIKPTKELLKDAVVEAGKFNQEIPKAGPIIKSTTQRMTELGQEIAVVARGAIGIAQGFGLINSEAASVLQNVITIGENLGKALGGDPTAIIGVIGGLTGAISTLFGESAESKAHKQLISENNQRLRDLRNSLGDVLRLNTPGAQLADAEKALAAFFGQTDRTKIANQFNKVNAFELGKILAEFGLDRATLAKIAEDLDLEIINKETGKLDLEGLRKLLEGLQLIDTQFGDAFADQMERIRTLINAGLLEPAEELGATLDVLSKAGKRTKFLGGAIPEALAGIDLSSESGRAQGLTALQELLLRFDKERGKGGFDLDDFGDLTAREFQDAILTLISFLSKEPIKVEPADGPTPQPEPPEPEPSSPVTGGVETFSQPLVPATVDTSDWDALLGLETRQADTLDAILASLGTFTPVTPPSLPAGLLGGSSRSSGAVVQFSGPVIETLSVHVAPGQDAQAVGEQIGQELSRAFLERVAAGLRSLQLDERQLGGNAARI